MHKNSRVFARKPVLKNGKEAIFEGLFRVPRVPSRFIAPLRSATRLRRAPTIPAVLEYATNLNSHTCLQTGTQFANKRLSCNQLPRLQTNASNATNTTLATNTTIANQRTSCKQPHLTQTGTQFANKRLSCNKHTACNKHI